MINSKSTKVDTQVFPVEVAELDQCVMFYVHIGQRKYIEYECVVDDQVDVGKAWRWDFSEMCRKRNCGCGAKKIGGVVGRASDFRRCRDITWTGRTGGSEIIVTRRVLEYAFQDFPNFSEFLPVEVVGPEPLDEEWLEVVPKTVWPHDDYVLENTRRLNCPACGSLTLDASGGVYPIRQELAIEGSTDHIATVYSPSWDGSLERTVSGAIWDFPKRRVWIGPRVARRFLELKLRQVTVVGYRRAR